MPVRPPSLLLLRAHRRSPRARRLPALVGVAALALLLLLLLAGCGEDEGEGDLRSFCAVARDRDLAQVLRDRVAGPPEVVAVQGGTFAPDLLDSFTSSFADIVAEDSPPEVRTDAEAYGDALAAAASGEPPEGAELDAALAAGDRLTDFLDAECGDLGT